MARGKGKKTKGKKKAGVKAGAGGTPGVKSGSGISSATSVK